MGQCPSFVLQLMHDTNVKYTLGIYCYACISVHMLLLFVLSAGQVLNLLLWPTFLYFEQRCECLVRMHPSSVRCSNLFNLNSICCSESSPLL